MRNGRFRDPLNGKIVYAESELFCPLQNLYRDCTARDACVPGDEACSAAIYVYFDGKKSDVLEKSIHEMEQINCKYRETLEAIRARGAKGD